MTDTVASRAFHALADRIRARLAPLDASAPPSLDTYGTETLIVRGANGLKLLKVCVKRNGGFKTISQSGLTWDHRPGPVAQEGIAAQAAQAAAQAAARPAFT